MTGTLPVMIVEYMSRYVSDVSPPILVGILPPKEYIEPSANLCRFVSCSIVDGMLPVMEVENICRYINDIMPPMLVGILPFSEDKDSI